MIPMQDLLNRIRWDREFGTGSFEISYEDHEEERLLRVPFHEIVFEEGNRFSFQVQNREGAWVTIPFHRVREVYRNGQLIWQREEQGV